MKIRKRENKVTIGTITKAREESGAVVVATHVGGRHRRLVRCLRNWRKFIVAK
jgi:hypothetical protein